MNTKITRILMMALSVAALSSCSSAYRMGQTPDDVYYSPARPQAQSVARNQDEYLSTPGNSQRYNGSNGSSAYNDYDNNYRNDRFLRMSMGNRMRLSSFNDYYWNDPYYGGIGFNNFGGGFSSPWNSYYYWNNYYNPYSSFSLYSPFYGGSYYGGGFGGGGWYGGGTVIGNPSKTPVTVNNSLRPSTFSRSTYMNNNYSNNNRYLDRNSSTTRPTATGSRNRYNNNNNNSNSYYNTNSNSNRRQSTYENNSNFNNTRSNNTYTQPSRSYEAPTRSYSPSSSGSSSGSSGGGGGVSRPTRN